MVHSDLTQNHPAKILYVTSSPQLAGAERCLLNIVRNLDQTQFAALVLVPGEGSLARELRENGVDVRVCDLAVLDNKRELYSPKILMRLFSLGVSAFKTAALIRRERVTLVHSNTSAVLVGSLAAAIAHVPHIWHVREILVQPSQLWAVMQWLIPLMSERVLCISTQVKDHFRISPRYQSRLIVLHDAIDEQSFVEAEDDASDLALESDFARCRVSIAARVNPWKGHQVFIRAAALVLQQCPQVRFYIAGGCLPAYESILRSMEKLIQECKIADDVRLLGDLTHAQVSALVRQSDIVVVPSILPEPFGLTILEGMAFSKTVIATDAGGPRDIVIPEVTGLLVPPGDADALAQAILLVIENPSLRLSMGAAGRKRLLDHFGLKAQMQSLEAIYHDLLHQNSERCVGHRGGDE